MITLRIFEDGDKCWLLDNLAHRANGPAIQWAGGILHWYWHDQEVTEYELMMLAGQEITNG